MRRWQTLRPSRLPTANVAAGLMLAGVLILFLRNPDPVLNPVLYAEDGAWAGLGLTQGWLRALLLARQDYFVSLNLLLLVLATQISDLVSGNPLNLLPWTVALVSYVFFAGTATLAFFTIRRISSSRFGLLAFGLVLLLPLGGSQNEILGRIVQIGFFMPLIAVLLLFWRDRVLTRPARLGIDGLLLLAAATNPLVIALVGLYLGADLARDWHPRAWLRRTATLALPQALLLAALLPRLGGNGAIPGGLETAHLVETALARALLYPFAFPWYRHLSDGATLLLTAFLGAFIVLAYRQSTDKEGRWLIAFGTAALAACTLATLAMRPGLTAMLGDYRGTFPDRYFMGLNVLTVLLFAAGASQLAGEHRAPLTVRLPVAILLLVYLAHLPALFETLNPRLKIRTAEDFPRQLCASEATGDGETQYIPIYPTPWRMVVPSRYVDKTGCPGR